MCSEAQGRRREAGSEGSVEQNRDLTNRNRISGSPGRTSGQLTAKSSCAAKAVELTSGGLRRVPNRRRRGGTEDTVRRPHRGAGVSRGHSRPKPSVRSSGTLARKGRNGQGSHDRERAAEGPNDREGESDS